ncbi:hypothetical protein ACTQ49_11715 [Luteococcus sp. Sow4_B9]|uniref:hypothetical protein n=1 Tax=Luteococcus sp. Sow4_B9 TaxID=3438792 RepID=UPI003F961958
MNPAKKNHHETAARGSLPPCESAELLKRLRAAEEAGHERVAAELHALILAAGGASR